MLEVVEDENDLIFDGGTNKQSNNIDNEQVT